MEESAGDGRFQGAPIDASLGGLPGGSKPRPLSILHTEASCGWGGQEIRILSEAAGLIARGHRVMLACPRQARIFGEAQKRGVPVVALPIGRKSLAGLLALRAHLRRQAFDVINCHSSTDSWLAALACASLAKPPPLLRTRHISAPVPDNLASRWLYGKATRHIVTTGEALRRKLAEENGFPRARITSVPTGVDPGRFCPGDKAQAKAALGLAQDRRHIGIVATLRSWKGHLHLLEAFAELARPGWQLVIVGDGPMREVIAAKVAALGLAQSVLLAGGQDKPELWLRAMDVFCLPSYANEGVPQALIQAMLTGLPVISTPVGSIGELVRDGETGILVEAGKPAALAQALRRLIDDPRLCHDLGRRAQAWAGKNCSLERMLDAMEGIFAQLADRGAAPGKDA